MATAVTLYSPQEVVDYLNSITLPAEWWVIDKGARITVIDDKGSEWAVETLFDETAVLPVIAAATEVKTIVPKKAGGHFMFLSPDDVAGGSNAYQLEIVSDAQELEDFLNTAIMLLATIEHGTKSLIIYT